MRNTAYDWQHSSACASERGEAVLITLPIRFWILHSSVHSHCRIPFACQGEGASLACGRKVRESDWFACMARQTRKRSGSVPGWRLRVFHKSAFADIVAESIGIAASGTRRSRNSKEAAEQMPMGKISRRGRVIFPCSISPLRQTQKSTGRPRNPVLEKAILPAKLPRPFLRTHRVLGRRKAAAKGKSDGLGTGSGCPLCHSPYP